ncbi:MAG: hypothetical protein RIE53_07700 [Rhodothermales bacterium]
MRAVAGAFGGFVLGALTGLLGEAGVPYSLSFGFFCAIAGLLAGAVGHVLFARVDHSAAIRSIGNYAIIGSVFFVSMSLATPDSISVMMGGVPGPLASLVAGFVGGAAGGATILILLGGYAGASRA